jgi:L-serine dehydratase
MAISIFELFKIGIGPSSSHTVGPMKAAFLFVEGLQSQSYFKDVTRIKADLFGSLGATGKGHGSDKAILLGLEGELPDKVNPNNIPERLLHIRNKKEVNVFHKKIISFDEDKDLIMHREESLPYHPNGMRFTAYNISGEIVRTKIFYSVGGGFVLNDENIPNQSDPLKPDSRVLKYPFTTMTQLLSICAKSQLRISQVMLANETSWQSEEKTKAGLLNIWKVMQACVEKGIKEEGILPGGLNVKRRANNLYKQLCSRPEANLKDPLAILDWVNLYALAVNEENASGGRVVTAPTNGAAGIIPAVLHYYMNFNNNATEEKAIDFLLTAGAIAIIFKENASISGADVGCQGEVGVACSMAAGALTEVLGGTPGQVENAAEIGMEHNLGLTCDPIGGLVQIPCIERNAMGSVKAINASRIALRGDGSHFVSLDNVVKTMRETGADMQTKYKETSRGGLAVNVIEC